MVGDKFGNRRHRGSFRTRRDSACERTRGAGARRVAVWSRCGQSSAMTPLLSGHARAHCAGASEVERYARATF